LGEIMPEVISIWAKRELRPFISNEVQERLQRAPGAVHYPIQWTSERQRLAFFATDGFGHGIPYTRSDEMIKDWHVRGDYHGGLTDISVYNDAPQAQYVYGDESGLHQQQFHLNTGWPRFVDQAQVIALEADALIEDAMPMLFFQALRQGPSGRGRANR
jgi:hypothetical protein